MARKELLINHWPNTGVSGQVNLGFDYASKFADLLVWAVVQATKEIAIKISSQPVDAFGNTKTVARADGSVSSEASLDFREEMDLNSTLGGTKHGHSNAYARHFMAQSGRTVPMDYGNLVEQVAYKFLVDKCPPVVGGQYDYIYNDSNDYPGRFDISYFGASKSARPDFRLSLVGFGGGEAIFDITAEKSVGHIMDKKVNKTSLGDIVAIKSGYEISYSDSDTWDM